LGVADLPFPAGSFQSLPEFFTIKRNTLTIPFDHTNLSRFNPFISCKTFAARTTCPAATNNKPVITGSCIDHFIIILMAKRTAHSNRELLII
jgi:hypothetical protein